MLSSVVLLVMWNSRDGFDSTVLCYVELSTDDWLTAIPIRQIIDISYSNHEYLRIHGESLTLAD
jgi:hypothetical protein